MRLRPALCGLAALVGPLIACSGDDRPAAAPGAFESLVAASTPGRWRATGSDRIEVWVCHVPPTTVAPIYGGLPLRVPMAPATLASLFQQRVARYFEQISHRLYSPVFVAGGEVSMGATDDQHDCIDAAIAGAAAGTRAVLAVADAEHAADQPGGTGNGGAEGAPEGPVRATRRAAYVGAADFDRGTWGDDPPMDLVEHELGHTLGWAHSGLSASGGYLSAIDLMSNSAGPRDADPSRRDGPDVLAIHRVVAGWLPVSDVAVASGTVSTELAPSTGASGRRLLVLPTGAGSFLTVELLTADGYDGHLPAGGIAVHRVTVAGGAVTAIEPLHAAAPYTSLLQPGDTLVTDGWTITVTAAGHVQAVPT